MHAQKKPFPLDMREETCQKSKHLLNMISAEKQRSWLRVGIEEPNSMKRGKYSFFLSNLKRRKVKLNKKLIKLKCL